MQLVICDNKEIEIKQHTKSIIIYADESNPCIGCFKCWCNQNNCILKDNKSIKDLFEKANRIIIITKNTYGSLSVPIKRLFDRSISSVQPFFTFRHGLMRHKLKKNHIYKDIDIYFYGNCTDNEKHTARNMLSSLCENLGATLKNIWFNPILKRVIV